MTSTVAGAQGIVDVAKCARRDRSAPNPGMMRLVLSEEFNEQLVSLNSQQQRQLLLLLLREI